MFIQAIHIDAAEALSRIGVKFNAGQYVFNDKGFKGRILADHGDGLLSVCWQLKAFRDTYRNHYTKNTDPLISIVFEREYDHETWRVRASEEEKAIDTYVEENGEPISIKIRR